MDRNTSPPWWVRAVLNQPLTRRSFRRYGFRQTTAPRFGSSRYRQKVREPRRAEKPFPCSRGRKHASTLERVGSVLPPARRTAYVSPLSDGVSPDGCSAM